MCSVRTRVLWDRRRIVSQPAAGTLSTSARIEWEWVVAVPLVSTRGGVKVTQTMKHAWWSVLDLATARTRGCYDVGGCLSGRTRGEPITTFVQWTDKICSRETTSVHAVHARWYATLGCLFPETMYWTGFLNQISTRVYARSRSLFFLPFLSDASWPTIWLRGRTDEPRDWFQILSSCAWSVRWERKSPSIWMCYFSSSRSWMAMEMWMCCIHYSEKRLWIRICVSCHITKRLALFNSCFDWITPRPKGCVPRDFGIFWFVDYNSYCCS